MAMSENKNLPLSEEVEFDAVDLEKQPKRVRKADAKPPTRKKSTPAKKSFSKPCGLLIIEMSSITEHFLIGSHLIWADLTENLKMLD